ncbi:MAG TPA: malonate decarboxylase acyl carrier protein, partial [Mycobacteriales bacterium]|nr:malonate decarboxylase acyl carrier protein [Mycobacteriales bacterium]
MQTLQLRFPADRAAGRRAHVGVVASGDLEVLFEPGPGAHAEVRVRTSVDGFDETWHDVLERFFARTPLRGRWELNDYGATPGVVALRLRQAAEAAESPESPAPAGAAGAAGAAESPAAPAVADSPEAAGGAGT